MSLVLYACMAECNKSCSDVYKVHKGTETHMANSLIFKLQAWLNTKSTSKMEGTQILCTSFYFILKNISDLLMYLASPALSCCMQDL